MTLADLFKNLLTRLGRVTTPRMIHSLNAATNYLEVGRWCQEHGFHPAVVVKDRFELFQYAYKLLGDERVAYLEFGVWRGESMRYWSKMLKHPDSALHGFDSFEGLPEYWKLDKDKGVFSTAGQVPKIDDSRVTFHKGWFDDTLRAFKVPRLDRLFLNLDADLYSSTMTVLNALRGDIRAGDMLYFDEFCDRNHELRAFDEFLRNQEGSYRLLCSDPTYNHVLFERTQ
jgi:hypothetical protein